MFRKKKTKEEEITRLSHSLSQSSRLKDILSIRRSGTYIPVYKLAERVVTTQSRPSCCPSDVTSWLEAIHDSFKNREKLRHERKYKEEYRRSVIRGEYSDYIMSKMLIIN
jgi:hypothetical protein